MKNTTKRKVAKWLLVIAGAVLVLSLTGCPDNKELTGTVKIDGTMEVGETVTAEIEDSNGTAGKFTYQWTRTEDGKKALEIEGANGKTYLIDEEDLNHTLGVIIDNADTVGTITGTAAEKVKPARVAQDLPIVVNGTGGNSVTVIIKYMALPETTPSYISKIQQALGWIDEYNALGNKTGTVTITVISGNSGFVKNGTKNLDVGDEWLSTAESIDIYDALLVGAEFINDWFTMIQPNTRDAVRLANVPVPQYNRAMQLRDNRIASRMVRQRLG